MQRSSLFLVLLFASLLFFVVPRADPDNYLSIFEGADDVEEDEATTLSSTLCALKMQDTPVATMTDHTDVMNWIWDKLPTPEWVESTLKAIWKQFPVGGLQWGFYSGNQILNDFEICKYLPVVSSSNYLYFGFKIPGGIPGAKMENGEAWKLKNFCFAIGNCMTKQYIPTTMSFYMKDGVPIEMAPFPPGTLFLSGIGVSLNRDIGKGSWFWKGFNYNTMEDEFTTTFVNGYFWMRLEAKEPLGNYVEASGTLAKVIKKLKLKGDFDMVVGLDKDDEDSASSDKDLALTKGEWSAQGTYGISLEVLGTPLFQLELGSAYFYMLAGKDIVKIGMRGTSTINPFPDGSILSGVFALAPIATNTTVSFWFEHNELQDKTYASMRTSTAFLGFEWSLSAKATFGSTSDLSLQVAAQAEPVSIKALKALNNLDTEKLKQKVKKFKAKAYDAFDDIDNKVIRNAMKSTVNAIFGAATKILDSIDFPVVEKVYVAGRVTKSTAALQLGVKLYNKGKETHWQLKFQNNWKNIGDVIEDYYKEKFIKPLEDKLDALKEKWDDICFSGKGCSGDEYCDSESFKCKKKKQKGDKCSVDDALFTDPCEDSTCKCKTSIDWDGVHVSCKCR